MKNLLKLGQGPRPDLMFEEEEKKTKEQSEGQKKKVEFEKGIRTVRKEAKKKARKESKNSKKSEWIEMSRKDKMAVILAFCELLLPVAIGVLAIFGILIWFLGKFWLHAW